MSGVVSVSPCGPLAPGRDPARGHSLLHTHQNAVTPHSLDTTQGTGGGTVSPLGQPFTPPCTGHRALWDLMPTGETLASGKWPALQAGSSQSHFYRLPDQLRRADSWRQKPPSPTAKAEIRVWDAGPSSGGPSQSAGKERKDIPHPHLQP